MKTGKADDEAPTVGLPAFRVFISCVSSEFKHYRDDLRGCLTSPGREVEIQEDFADGGGTLLAKLDDYIRSCQAMIHLVGDACGCSPQQAEVREVLARHPRLKDELPELATDFESDPCPLTYTQWEVFLAIYHRVDCFIYLAEEGTRREVGWNRSEADSASQEAHRARLHRLGQDRRTLPFYDYRDVAFRFLNAINVPAAVRLENQVGFRPPVSWPTPPARLDYPLADREWEFNAFVGLLREQSQARIYLVTGPSDRGKSVLVGHFARVARGLRLRCAHEECKTGLVLEHMLWGLTRDLAPLRFPRFERERRRNTSEALRTAFLDDLDEAREPVLFILDAYEQATEEAKRWIEDSFLPHFCRHDGLRLVLAGQNVPPPEGHPWGTWTIHRALPPIRDVASWRDYSRRVLGLANPDQDIRLLVEAARGSPRVLSSLLWNLKNNDSGAA
jgi:hypothetical protein